MSFAPGILAALFGVPALTVTQPSQTPDVKVETTQQTSSGEALPTLISELKDIMKGGFGEIMKDRTRRMKFIMVIMVIISWLLFAVIAIAVLILYIQIQLILYRNSKKSAEQAILESKKPYMDTLEYQVMNPSIFAKYPYRALFYLAAVAFTLMILAYLFKIQLSQDKNPGGQSNDEDDETPLEEAVFYGAIISLYLFGAFYYVLEYSYYKKIVDYNAKITDFNQFVRSILPGNYAFLTLVSKATEDTVLDNSVYVPALEALNPNKRELVRGLCILNLYTYYHEQRGNYTRPGGVSNVLTCFNPINRILPTASSCFSDHLIHNNSFVENRISKYISLLEAMDGEKGISKIFKANRTQILLDVDKMMNEINQRGSCLGSSTAYHKFLTMNTRAFLVVWIPFLFFFVKGTTNYFKKTSSL